MAPLVAALLLVVASWPEPLVLDPSGPPVSAAGHLQVAKTPGGLRFDDARTLTYRAPGSGFYAEADGRRYAARLGVASSSPRPSSWVVTLEFESATATLVRADGTRETHRTGWGVPVGEWTDVVSGVPSIRLDLEAGERVDLYLDVEKGAGYAPDAQVRVSERNAYEARQRRAYALQMAFLGVFLALAVYKLFLYASFRDRSYLYYVAFSIGTAVYWVTREGFVLEFLLGLTGRGWPELNFYVLAVAAVGYGQFVRHYLRTRSHAPRLDRVLVGVSIAWAASAVACAAGAWEGGTTAAALAGLVLVMATFAAGVTAYRAGYRPALDYLIAAASFLVVSVGYIGLYLVDSELAGSASGVLQLAMLLEVVLLARALSLRIQTVTAERSAAVAAHERSEAERAALEEMSEFKSRMLGIAAHDLRSPLGTVIGFADMLAYETPGRPDLHEYTDSIQRSAERMLELTEGLLGRAALENKDLKLDVGRVDVCGLVLEAATEYRVRSVEKGQRLTLRLPDEVYADVDPERFRAVVDNLVSNAVKYTPVGGEVEVSVEATGSAVEVRVADSGPGFTAEDQEQLFEPFQRLSARPTGGETSTGLGLSIVKQIVDLHGGQIRVESEPGRGATFVITLEAQNRATTGSTSARLLWVAPGRTRPAPAPSAVPAPAEPVQQMA